MQVPVKNPVHKPAVVGAGVVGQAWVLQAMVVKVPATTEQAVPPLAAAVLMV